MLPRAANFARSVVLWQVLAEDTSKNRMVEAVELFEQICNSTYFQEMNVILFLNKRDLFEEKIKTVDPGKWFPEYTGGCDYKKAEAFFKKMFEDRLNVANPASKRMLFIYTTCATDTKNVQNVFDALSTQLTEAVYNLLGT